MSERRWFNLSGRGHGGNFYAYAHADGDPRLGVPNTWYAVVQYVSGAGWMAHVQIGDETGYEGGPYTTLGAARKAAVKKIDEVEA